MQLRDYLSGRNIPEISNWQFYFKRNHGRVNRRNVLQAFDHFLTDPFVKVLPMPGFSMIGGKVHGHETFEDGKEIVTSYIRRLFILDREEMQAINREYGNDDSMYICVETNNNSLYFIDYRKRNVYMDELEIDSSLGQLSDERGHYVAPGYSQYNFL